MTTPNVTEIARHLEPTTPDPFLAGETTGEIARPVLRELDHRRNDGIDVRLLWSEVDDQVSVAVSDARTGDAFVIAVEGHEARDAFQHPYAYAALRR
jgi:hypothetical protein